MGLTLAQQLTSAPATTVGLNAISQFEQDIQTVVNPTLGQVINDTGALAAGTYFVTITFNCSVQASINIQHRNAANAATLGALHLVCGSTGAGLTLSYFITLAANERIRAISPNAVTGTWASALLVVRSS